jgi:hypothetical protein
MISTPLSPRSGGELRRHGGMRRVRVEAGHPARRGDPLGQQVQDPARTTAEIDRALPRPQTYPVQKRRPVSGQFLSLTLQPGTLAPAAAQRIDSAGIPARRAGSRPDGSAPAAPPRHQGRPAARYRDPQTADQLIRIKSPGLCRSGSGTPATTYRARVAQSSGCGRHSVCDSTVMCASSRLSVSTRARHAVAARPGSIRPPQTGRCRCPAAGCRRPGTDRRSSVHARSRAVAAAGPVAAAPWPSTSGGAAAAGRGFPRQW